MNPLSLHPEALEDLRRSGLDEATIAAAGLYTPAPGDLPRLLSARLVEKVRHVLVFPYDGAGYGAAWRRDDEFVRCKLFPPVSDGQGHTIRYYQRAGTPPRLYIPARAQAALADPTVPLLITEGEKKALKANQEGPSCVAVGGLWNWQIGGRPIADLDRIDWYEREAMIVPDSDVWTRPDLVQPVFALGKELEGRGTKVSVLKLPSGPGGAKVGLDDYLCTNPREAFAALPRLALKHAAFNRTGVWWRGWVKRKEAEEAGAGATARGVDLAELSEQAPDDPAVATRGLERVAPLVEVGGVVRDRLHRIGRGQGIETAHPAPGGEEAPGALIEADRGCGAAGGERLDERGPRFAAVCVVLAARLEDEPGEALEMLEVDALRARLEARSAVLVETPQVLGQVGRQMEAVLTDREHEVADRERGDVDADEAREPARHRQEAVEEAAERAVVEIGMPVAEEREHADGRRKPPAAHRTLRTPRRARAAAVRGARAEVAQTHRRRR
jgi:hypothetical protein